MSKSRRAPRLIDLHIDWMAQYRGETPNGGPTLPPERLDRLAGYLSTARAAFLFDDSPTTDDHAVDSWITRVLAEFPGRVLANPDDHRRWQLPEPEPLCWAVIGLGPAFADASSTPPSTDRLQSLADRGVRVFPATDDPALSLLTSLSELAARTTRTFALDLAHLPQPALAATLEWLEADPAHPAHLVPILSRSTYQSYDDMIVTCLDRIANLGGLIALNLASPSLTDPAALLDALAQAPETQRSAFALATDYLTAPDLNPELARADQLTRWITAKREPDFASSSIEQNAARLIARLTSSA